MAYDERFKEMLAQECPDCKRDAGEIITYTPIIKSNGDILVEMECENCGFGMELTCNLISAEERK